MQNLEQVKDERFSLSYLKETLNELSIKLNIDEPQTNFDWLVKIVYDLRNSQGFYYRLWKNLCSVDICTLSCYIDDINSASKFNDVVNVIMYLEG